MFGGIETTEGMIANAAWYLLGHPGQLDLVRADPALLPQAIEESLRLEPAAAVVNRYATRDVAIGGAEVTRGDLVSVSVAGAGRDPAAFTDPDRFDVRRGNTAQTSPSPAARTSAWGSTWPAWKPGRRSPRPSASCPACGSTWPAPLPPAAGSSASPRRCPCAGTPSARAARGRLANASRTRACLVDQAR